jgi:hypothetical protein
MLGRIPERLLFPRNLTILISCKRKHWRRKTKGGGGGGVQRDLWLKHKFRMATKEGINQDLQAMGAKCSALV